MLHIFFVCKVSGVDTDQPFGFLLGWIHVQCDFTIAAQEAVPCCLRYRVPDCIHVFGRGEEHPLSCQDFATFGEFDYLLLEEFAFAGEHACDGSSRLVWVLVFEGAALREEVFEQLVASLAELSYVLRDAFVVRIGAPDPASAIGSISEGADGGTQAIDEGVNCLVGLFAAGEAFVLVVEVWRRLPGVVFDLINHGLFVLAFGLRYVRTICSLHLPPLSPWLCFYFFRSLPFDPGRNCFCFLLLC